MVQPIDTEFEIVPRQGLDALLEDASVWNQLRSQSDSLCPTTTAESLINWLDHFQGNREFQVIWVWRDSEPIAALPLILQSRGTLTVGLFPNNPWSFNGDVLLDRRVDPAVVWCAILEALPQAGIDLLWLEGIPVKSTRWGSLVDLVNASNWNFDIRLQHDVGEVAIAGEFVDYYQKLSKNHRKSMNAAVRKLRQIGQLRLERQKVFDDSDLEPKLLQMMELEDRGWKGRNGSSVLSTTGLFDFYREQCLAISRQGELELQSLWLDDELLAYEVGYCAEGIYYSHKVGFNENFEKYSPGQVLMFLALEEMHSEGGVEKYDCLGELSFASSRWITGKTPRHRLALAPGTRKGRWALQWFQRLKPLYDLVRQIRVQR